TTARGCGANPPPDRGSAAVARYRTFGRLDKSFGGDGRVATAYLGSERSAAHYDDMRLMEGGFVAATGSANDVADRRFVVIVGEYVRSGARNTSFSGDGQASVRGPYDVAVGIGIIVDPDA